MPLELKHDSLAERILMADRRTELFIIESRRMEDRLVGDDGISEPVPQTLSKARQWSWDEAGCH